MKTFLGVVCVAWGLAAAGAALAQTSQLPSHVFATVDAIKRMGDTSLYVTGVLDGASGPSEVRLNAYANVAGLDACERFAVMLMTKPGQYRLKVWAGNPTSSSSVSYCQIEKLNP